MIKRAKELLADGSVDRVIGWKKGDIVNPKGAILVDDFMPNLEYWYEMGGIPIKFSDTNKECKFTKINDLLELLEIDFLNKVKIKE